MIRQGKGSGAGERDEEKYRPMTQGGQSRGWGGKKERWELLSGKNFIAKSQSNPAKKSVQEKRLCGGSKVGP